MKLVFAGTPAVAVPTMRALQAAGHEIMLVLTRTDAPRGRKRVLTASEVAVAAEELGLRVLKRNRIEDDLVAELQHSGAELGVVVAYGALLKPPALEALPLGWINLHFSLLPAWRGAAPVQHNLLHGGPTGVTVFQLDQGVDTGPVWEQHPLAVDPDATAGEVLAEFAERGTKAVVDAIERIAAGSHPVEQHGPASHASKLHSADGQLHPNAGIAAVYARFRAVTPEPGAWIYFDGERLKVLDARAVGQPFPLGSFAPFDGIVAWGTGDGALELRRVQPAGKAAMPAVDWWRGRR